MKGRVNRARGGLLAGAVAMLMVPALAGCEAGLNAPTLQFHPASSGAHGVVNGITINNMFVLAAPSGSSLAAGSSASVFFALWNNGTSSDMLTGVSASSAAKSATITAAGGQVQLPPNAGVNLTGPAPEVVLSGLTSPLAGGEDISVTLTFADAGPITLDVPVEPQSFSFSDLSQPPSATPTP